MGGAAGRSLRHFASSSLIPKAGTGVVSGEASPHLQHGAEMLRGSTLPPPGYSWGGGPTESRVGSLLRPGQPHQHVPRAGHGKWVQRALSLRAPSMLLVAWPGLLHAVP